MSVIVNEFEVVPETAPTPQRPQAAEVPPAQQPALDEEIERVVQLRIDRLLRVHAD